MKYKTIGAFKNVQNVPYCKAASDLYVGMGVIIDRADKTATKPADETECKACHYIVTNICDKPETRNSTDFVVKQGEYVRADDLTTVANMEVEFASSEITTAYVSLAVGDTLVFGTDGKLAKETILTGYGVYFEILEKTGYCDSGVLALIHVV
jgi:hypothetical protein